MKYLGLVRMILWFLGALSLIIAWIAIARRGLIFGLEPLAWYWNALILGILSAGIKTKKEESSQMM
jgi:hypothetical protein